MVTEVRFELTVSPPSEGGAISVRRPRHRDWCQGSDSNARLPACRAGTLPLSYLGFGVVGKNRTCVIALRRRVPSPLSHDDMEPRLRPAPRRRGARRLMAAGGDPPP